MKLNLKKAAVSAAIAGALLFAAPTVAQAYVEEGPNTVVLTITADGPVSVGGFVAGADVTFTLSGVGVTDSNIATAGARATSASVVKTADASGSATAGNTLPEPQVGTYRLAATGQRADGTAGTSTTVVGGGSSSEAGNSLAVTGIDANSMLGLWVGGGALVLAGGTVAMATTVRRNRAQTKA